MSLKYPVQFTAVVIAFIAAASVPAEGALIVQQEPFGDAGFRSDNSGDIAADDFQAGTTVTETDQVVLTWWGRYNATIPNTADFQIRFYADAGSEPPTLPTSQPFFTVNVSDGAFDDEAYSSGDLFEFSVQFMGLNLSANDIYWLSVISTAGVEWRWESGNDNILGSSGLDTALAIFDGLGASGTTWSSGTGENDQIPNLAFTLEILESGGPVVPEPSSLALLGLGSLGMIGFRRRKTSPAA